MVVDIDIKQVIRTVDDFPKPGIKFLDVAAIFENPLAFRKTVNWLKSLISKHSIDHIIAIDARGFVWGGAVANELMMPLHIARKPGKLPGAVVTKEYSLEYGTASLSMLKNAPIHGKVIVIDDILATGGTLNAVGELLAENWNIPFSNQVHSVIAGLDFLPGKEMLTNKGFIVESMINYQ